MESNLRIGIDNRNAVAGARVITSSLGDVKKSAMGAVGAIAALAGIGSTLAIVRKAVDTYRMLETALIGVGKTSNMSGKDLQQFGLDVQNLARRLPVAQQELLGIAEAAAQLGVEGQENLLKFSETVAKLGRTSNLQGDAAATALARILNVTKEGMGSVDRLASVIVRLGNTSAATESEIAEMSTEIAKSTSLFGFSAAEAAGYSAALKDMGAEAELSSTSIFSLLTTLDSSSRKGAEGMKVLEQITGMTGEKFRAAFKENAADALTIFLDGLNRLKAEGQDVSSWLQQFGLDGIRVGKVLPPLAANVDALRKYLAAARGEWQSNSAMQKEFENSAKSTDSQLQLLNNALTEFFQEVGRGANAGLRDLVALLTELGRNGGGVAKSLGEILGGALRLLADALRLIVEHGTEVKLILGVLAVMKFKGIIESIGPLTEASRLIEKMGIGGAKLLAMNVGSGMVEGFKAALAAINPVYLVIAAIAAVVLLVTKNLNDAYDSFIKNTEAANKWAGEVTRLRALLAGGHEAVKGADVESAKNVLAEMRALSAQMATQIAAYKPSALNNLNGKAEDNRQRVEELASMNAKIKSQELLVSQLGSAYEAMGGAAGEALDKAAADELEKQRLADARATADAAARNLELIKTIEDVTKSIRTESDSLAAQKKILAENGGNWDRAAAGIAAVQAVVSQGIKPTSEAGKRLIEMALANEKVRQSLERSKSEFDTRKSQMEQIGRATKEATDARLSQIAQLNAERRQFNQTLLEARDSAALELEDARRMAEATKQGAAAVRALNVELEIERRLRALDPNNTADHNSEKWKAIAAGIRKSVEGQEELAVAANKTATAWGKGVGWLTLISQISGAVGGKFDKMVQSAVGFAQAMQQAAEAQAKGDTMGGMMAGAAAGQSVFGFGQAAGAWQGNRGQGQHFGGQMSGDYADIGAMVGGIIGSFWGPVGTAVGSILGGILGGAIKKGADEGLATLNMDADRVALNIMSGANGLNKIVGELGHKVIEGFQSIVDSIGGQLIEAPTVQFKIRDDVITVFVNGFKKQFEDMDSAVAFAIAEMLRTSKIGNIDAMLAEVLRSGANGDLETLQRNLEATMKVMGFGMTESQKNIQMFTNELDGLRRQMLDLLGPSENLARALQNIGQEEIRRWQSSRDQITGEKRSNAEKLQMLKADATMWNAEKALRIADLTMQRDTLLAKVKIVEAGGTLNSAEAVAAANYLRTKAELYGYEIEVGKDHLAALGEVDQAALAQLKIMIDAINLVIGALNDMPDIDVPHLRLPNVGGGGGLGNVNTGPTDADRLKAFNEQMQDLRDEQLPDGTRRMKEITDQFALLRAEAEHLGIAQDELSRLETAALHRLGEDAIGSLGLPLEGMRDQFAQLADTMNFLHDNMEALGISTERYEQITRELGDQLFLDIASGLEQFIEDEGTRRELEEIRYDMTIAQYRLQFELIRATGALTQAQIDFIQSVFDKLPDDVPAGGFGNHGGGNTDSGGNNAAEEIARLRESVLDRIEKWNDLKLSPAERQLKALNAEFAQLEIDARKAGVSLDLVREAFNAALEDFWNGLLTPLRDFLDDLDLSDLSSLTPQQRLNEAQARFDDIAGRARAGDLEAIQQLPGAAQQLLDEARSFFAGSEGFAAILNTVQSVIEQILGQHGLSSPAPTNTGSGNPLLAQSGSRGSAFDGGSGGSSSAPAPSTSPLEQRLEAVAREQAATRLQASNDNAALRAQVAETNRRLQEIADQLRRDGDGAGTENRAAWGGR